MSLTQKVLWENSLEGMRYQEIKKSIEAVSWQHLPVVEDVFIEKYPNLALLAEEKLCAAWKEKISQKKYFPFHSKQRLYELSRLYATPKVTSLMHNYNNTRSYFQNKYILFSGAVTVLAAFLALQLFLYQHTAEQKHQEFELFEQYRQMPRK